MISRATRKCQSKALQAKPIFDIACYIASHRNVALPNSAEALHTLEMASPRPGGGLNVRVRQWPLTPTADVSVIVPCYNEEQYVRQCIESIATQESDYSFEIIAVDDGSTDNTGAILDEMACKWPSIRVIHQDNLGFSGARNTGLACISGGCPYSFVNGVVPDFSTFSGPSKDSVSGFSTLAIGSTYGTLSRMTA